MGTHRDPLITRRRIPIMVLILIMDRGFMWGRVLTVITGTGKPGWLACVNQEARMP